MIKKQSSTNKAIQIKESLKSIVEETFDKKYSVHIDHVEEDFISIVFGFNQTKYRVAIFIGIKRPGRIRPAIEFCLPLANACFINCTFCASAIQYAESGYPLICGPNQIIAMVAFGLASLKDSILLSLYSEGEYILELSFMGAGDSADHPKAIRKFSKQVRAAIKLPGFIRTILVLSTVGRPGMRALRSREFLDDIEESGLEFQLQISIFSAIQAVRDEFIMNPTTLSINDTLSEAKKWFESVRSHHVKLNWMLCFDNAGTDDIFQANLDAIVLLFKHESLNLRRFCYLKVSPFNDNQEVGISMRGISATRFYSCIEIIGERFKKESIKVEVRKFENNKGALLARIGCGQLSLPD